MQNNKKEEWRRHLDKDAHNKEMKKLIAIVLSLIAIVSLMSFNVSAAEAETYTVTETQGKGTMKIISLNNDDAYCVQLHVKRPVVNTEYALTNYSISNIEPTCVAIYLLNDNSYDFRVAAQVALWSFVEGVDIGDTVYQFVGATDNARTFYDEIVETAKTINVNHYVVDIEYYASEGYQVLMTMNVEKIPPIMAPAPVIPEPEPEVEEIVPPVTEPEPQPEPEKEPEVIPETIPDPVPSVEEIEKPEPQPEPEKEPEVLADEPYYPEAPQTGDNSNITLWVVLMFVSLVGIIALIANKKHVKEEN